MGLPAFLSAPRNVAFATSSPGATPGPELCIRSPVPCIETVPCGADSVPESLASADKMPSASKPCTNGFIKADVTLRNEMVASSVGVTRPESSFAHRRLQPS